MKRKSIVFVILLCAVLLAMDEYGWFLSARHREIQQHFTKNLDDDLEKLTHRPGEVIAANRITRPVSGSKWYLRYHHPEMKDFIMDIILDENLQYLTYSTHHTND